MSQMPDYQVLANALPFHVRDVTMADAALLLTWTNDPLTLRNSLSLEPEQISASAHRVWLQAKLNSAGHHFFIVSDRDGTSIGQVRFEARAGYSMISYSIDPAFRGLNIGRAMLDVALQRYESRMPSSLWVVGIVKRSNETSIRVFQTLGFELLREDVYTVSYRRLTQSNDSRERFTL